jgi:hypothetical protein
MTHPQIASQGLTIIKIIEKLSNPDNDWHEATYSSLVSQLPELFDLVSDFVGAALAARGPNDGVAYWAEQAFLAAATREEGPGARAGRPRVSHIALVGCRCFEASPGCRQGRDGTSPGKGPRPGRGRAPRSMDNAE